MDDDDDEITCIGTWVEIEDDGVNGVGDCGRPVNVGGGLAEKAN